MEGTYRRMDLDDVIATEALSDRQMRPLDPGLESHMELELVQALSKKPREMFSKLVEAVLKISKAESAGISLLDESRRVFVWPAVVGGLAPYVGAGTPGDFGPCGTVLERDEAILFVHPERHFSYLEPISPGLEEVLLVPFHVDGKAVGTIWAVIHEPGNQFDTQDRLLLESLSKIAASAYRVLTENGALKRIIQDLPGPGFVARG